MSFSYFSTKTYAVGTQKNRLNEKKIFTFLCTKMCCWLKSKGSDWLEPACQIKLNKDSLGLRVFVAFSILQFINTSVPTQETFKQFVNIFLGINKWLNIYFAPDVVSKLFPFPNF